MGFGSYKRHPKTPKEVYYSSSPFQSVLLCAMVDDWRKQCSQAGVTLYCRHKLGGDLIPKSQLLRSSVTQSKCADDAALYTISYEGFKAVASSFVAVARLWGLTVSLVKSKSMVVGTGADASTYVVSCSSQRWIYRFGGILRKLGWGAGQRGVWATS